MAFHKVSVVALALLATTCAACDSDTSALPVLELEYVASIGDGDPATTSTEYLLGDPGMVRFGGDSLIYVADRGYASIKVYESNGNYVRSIGRRGRGPGEFQDVGPIAVVGDSLYVVDHMMTRVSLFSTSGELRATYRYDPGEVQWPRQVLVVDEGKSLLLGFSSTDEQTLVHKLDLDSGRVSRRGLDAANALCDVNAAHTLSYLHYGRLVQLAGDKLRFAPELYCGRQSDLVLPLLNSSVDVAATHNGFDKPFVEVSGLLPEGSVVHVRGRSSVDGHVISQLNGLVFRRPNQLLTFWTYLARDGRHQLVDEFDVSTNEHVARYSIPAWSEEADDIRHAWSTRIVQDGAADGRIALIDWSEGGPVVRILRLNP